MKEETRYTFVFENEEQAQVFIKLAEEETEKEKSNL